MRSGISELAGRQNHTTAPKVANDGTLVFGYREANVATGLVWMDRAGKIVRNIQPERLPFQLPSLRLSPDGTRVIMATRESGKTDYWVVDLARGARTRLTFDNLARGWFCNWTPDGQRVLYLSGDSRPVYKVMAKAEDGSGDAKVLVNGLDAHYSPDGKYIVYATGEGQRYGLWYVATTEGSKPVPFLVTPGDALSPEFSPDGNYVAYVSDESGHDEVYIKPFPAGEGKWQVSVGGGAVPRWSRRGGELFFVAGNELMAVPVRTKPSLILGQPQRLFARAPVQVDRPYGLYDGYDVSADGQHFVMLQSDEQQTTIQTLTVVQNWFAEFKEKQKR